MLTIRISRGLGFAALLCAVGAMAANEPTAVLARLETAVVGQPRTQQSSGFDGVVEPVRQTVLAAQVAGAVTSLSVKVGDKVAADQVVARLDAQAAIQATAAGDAQVQAARASLDLASKEFERQKQLYQKDYISQAALQRAEAQYKSAQAQVTALMAQAGATRTQTGFFLVKAPYAGVVSEVPVALGDMAMPGKPLLTIYDPAALRVTASIPQSIAAALTPDAAIRVQLPDLAASREWVTTVRMQVLPTSDAGTHTAQLRLDLPSSIGGAYVKPGLFARVWLPVVVESSSRVEVPVRAVVRRAELTAVYVVSADGRPLLRQVRVGRSNGESVEILSGISRGERVALDPQAAARVK
jgi:RND family efflux transporter MFP subunit